MALRIKWDQFEVALLIDACEQVNKRKLQKMKWFPNCLML